MQSDFVYILTDDPRDTVLYRGVSNDLERRSGKDSLGAGGAFAKGYAVAKLIRFETFPSRKRPPESRLRAKTEVSLAKTSPHRHDRYDNIFALFADGGPR